MEFTVEKKEWGSYSRINFQLLDGNCNIIIALLHLSLYMHTFFKMKIL